MNRDKFYALFAVVCLMIVFIGTPVFADPSDEATIGGQDSSGDYRWRVTEDGDLIPGGSAKLGTTTYPISEVHATTIYVDSGFALQGKAASNSYASGNQTVSLTYGLIAKTIGAGYEVLTIPDGSYAGQTIWIELISDGGGALSIRPTTKTGFTTDIGMTDVHDQVVLRWVSSTYGWMIVGQYGVTI